MTDSVPATTAKTQTTRQVSWVSGDTTIEVMPPNVIDDYKTAVTFKDFERYHNKVDWQCMPDPNTATLCQSTEPGADKAVWQHKPQQPSMEIIPYSMLNLVKCKAENSASGAAGDANTKKWMPVFPKSRGMGGLVVKAAWAPFVTNTDDGYQPNIVVYDDQATATGAGGDPVAILKATTGNAWCHARFMKGYQYFPRQKVCLKLLVTDAITASNIAFVQSAYDDGEDIDYGETGQMIPNFFTQWEENSSTYNQYIFQDESQDLAVSAQQAYNALNSSVGKGNAAILTHRTQANYMYKNVGAKSDLTSKSTEVTKHVWPTWFVWADGANTDASPIVALFNNVTADDGAYDVVGVYDTTTGNRVSGQGPQHSYLWQEGYKYRPGTLVTDIQMLYKCKPLTDGGDKCSDVRPSGLDSSSVWEPLNVAMTQLPYSEQRFQLFKFILPPNIATKTKYDAGWGSAFLNGEPWFSISSSYGTQHADYIVHPLTGQTIDSYDNVTKSTQYGMSDQVPAHDPIFWSPFYSLHMRSTGTSKTDAQRSSRHVNWSEYTHTNTKVKIDDYTQFNSWAQDEYRDHLTIHDDKVWTCEASRSWDCQDIPPGSMSSEANAIWRETQTKTSRYAFTHFAISWEMGYLFYPGQLATQDDGVFRCRDWPVSEGCSSYQPSTSAPGNMVWESTNILKAETTQTTQAAWDTKWNVADTTNAQPGAIQPQAWSAITTFQAFDPTFASGATDQIPTALKSDKVKATNTAFEAANRIFHDGSYFNIIKASTATIPHQYILQCRDWEDHINNDQFFKLGSYACADKQIASYDKGPVYEPTLMIRAFECISEYCSYHEPNFTETHDTYWRMSRAKAQVVPETKEIETRQCAEWRINHPYMSGDYVCNDNMVWMCLPGKDDLSSTDENDVYLKDYFTYKQQHLTQGCRNIKPSWFTNLAYVKWVPVKYWPEKVEYTEPQFQECVDHSTWGISHKFQIDEPDASPSFFSRDGNDVLYPYQTGEFACSHGMVYECNNHYGCNSDLYSDIAKQAKWGSDWGEGDEYWLPDHRFAWKLTRYLPKYITPSEKAAKEGRPEKECTYYRVNDEVRAYYDRTGDNVLVQNDQSFNPDNFRHVPGDTVCVYDEWTGAFNVWECPPAPAGNWCCTVSDLDPATTASENTWAYGSASSTAAVNSPAEIKYRPCQVTRFTEENEHVDTISIGPARDVDQNDENDEADAISATVTGIANRDPLHQNWVDITKKVQPLVSRYQEFVTQDENEGFKNMHQEYVNDELFRDCYEWRRVTGRQQTDPRYVPHAFEFGEYACQHFRLYECLQPELCTKTEPVSDDGAIWKITPFFSLYDERTIDVVKDPAEETIIVAEQAANAAHITVSEDSPDFKQHRGADCDPQYCYYWEANVAWLPGSYSCDASNQLWKCNDRQDIAAQCTITAPVYDSPDTKDEILVWQRIEKPSLPAVAPKQIVKDCTILDTTDSNQKYFFQVGSLACQKSTATGVTNRVWMCLNEKRCNNQLANANTDNVPWRDDLISKTTNVGLTNTDDVDGVEPAWKLTNYIANPKAAETLSCMTLTAWNFSWKFLMDDCVKTSDLVKDVHTSATDVLWKCKRPELCALINPTIPMFGDSFLDAEQTLLKRYGTGVWEPVENHDTTKVTTLAVPTITSVASCFRGDSFPPNEPFKTGDKVCIQPTAYGPYRFDQDWNTLTTTTNTAETYAVEGNEFQFKWESSVAQSSRTDEAGFKRVFQCVGGDLCNEIYPLEDLYRHEMNVQTGMLEWVGYDLSFRTIEEHEMTEAELVLTRDKSETVWKLTREEFPLFTTERTAWVDEYNLIETAAVNNLYNYDYTNFIDLDSNQQTNEVTQMTQPISNVAVDSVTGDRIFHDKPNWFPKYERNVYEYDSSSLYSYGQFVVSPTSDWLTPNDEHKSGNTIVWMCINPTLCSNKSPGAYFKADKKSYVPDEYKDMTDAEKDTLGLTVNFRDSAYVAKTQIKWLTDVWERRDQETPASPYLESSTLKNVPKKSYSWNGPYGKLEDNQSGYLKHYNFVKGDHVCYSPDPDGGIKERVYECVHATECKEFQPSDLRIDEYFIDLFDSDGDASTFTNAMVMHTKNTMWAKNTPLLNRGNPWKLTSYTCDKEPVTFQASPHQYNKYYLPGDMIVTTSTSPTSVYACIAECNQMSVSEIIDDAVFSATADNQLQWKKVTGNYNIEIVDAEDWPVINCTPLGVKYYPSPNFYPPNVEAGTPGGYACYGNNFVFECIHETCNHPDRWTDWKTDADTVSTTNAYDHLKKSLFYYESEDSVGQDPDFIAGDWEAKDYRNQYKIKDTNQLAWRQIRATSPTQDIVPTEDCTPWQRGRVYVTWDLVCSRTQVYRCKDKTLCHVQDPRLDTENDAWVKRDSIPRLNNIKTQPTIDCIEWDSERAAADYSQDMFNRGVQSEVWFSKFRESLTPLFKSKFQQKTAADVASVKVFAQNSFWDNGGTPVVTVQDGLVNQLHLQEDSKVKVSDVKALYLKDGDYVCMQGFVYKYRQDLLQKASAFTAGVTPGNQLYGIYNTRTGFGAHNDNFPAVAEFAATWEIQRAYPNPLVEERRVLPDVNCTFWEPYRPYLKGDIVCRFVEPHYAAVNVGYDYTLVAHMCRTEDMINTNHFHNKRDAQSRAIDPTWSATTALTVDSQRNGLCSGPVWEHRYSSDTWGNNKNTFDIDTTNTRSATGKFNIEVYGVSEYWIPIQANPILTTDRVFQHFQTCIHPLNFWDDDRRRLIGNEDHLAQDHDNYPTQYNLPMNVWQTTAYDSAGVASAGTSTTSSAADTEKCFASQSRMYRMDQRQYSQVPNWDKYCQATDLLDYTVKYALNALPKFIKPFRNTFNGDDVPQLCSWGRVYACTSNRDCNIARAGSASPTDAETVWVASSYAGWLDSTNDKLLKQTTEQNNYDPSFVLTRYYPFYQRTNKMIISATANFNNEDESGAAYFSQVDGEKTNNYLTVEAQTDDTTAPAVKLTIPQVKTRFEVDATTATNAFADSVYQVLMFADEKLQAIEQGVTTVSAAVTGRSDEGGTAITGTMAKTFSDSTPLVIVDLTTTGTHKTGYDYIFVSVVESNCIVTATSTASHDRCYARYGEPVWFRTKPGMVNGVDQKDVEVDSFGVANTYPPYVTTEWLAPSSVTTGSVTLFWDKHVGAPAKKYKVIYKTQDAGKMKADASATDVWLATALALASWTNTVEQADAAIIALDKPYVTITGLDPNKEIAYYVRPVLDDGAGGDLEGKVEAQTSAIVELYRLQPRTPPAPVCVGALDAAPVEMQAVQVTVSSTAEIDAMATSSVLGKGYHLGRRELGVTTDDKGFFELVHDTAPTIEWKNLYQYGNPEMLPQAAWESLTMLDSATATTPTVGTPDARDILNKAGDNTAATTFAVRSDSELFMYRAEMPEITYAVAGTVWNASVIPALKSYNTYTTWCRLKSKVVA